MSAQSCRCCARPRGLASDDHAPAWHARLQAGEPVVCLRSCERGLVVAVDDHSGEALVAFRRSTVICALCDLARPGDA